MVKRKRLGGIFGRTLTILTAFLGTPFYFATQCGPRGLSHWQGVGVKVAWASR
jgi:hypothetical protein